MTQVHTHPLQLADLHLPPPPDLWPLAWGWWVSGLTLFLSAILIYFIIRQVRKKRHRLAAKKQALQRLKHARSVSEINSLLQQTAFTYFPRAQIAGLNGKAWLAFLDQQLPQQHQGFLALSERWNHALYAAQVENDMLSTCRHQAEIWLKQLQLPPHAQGQQEDRHV